MKLKRILSLLLVLVLVLGMMPTAFAAETNETTASSEPEGTESSPPTETKSTDPTEASTAPTSASEDTSAEETEPAGTEPEDTVPNETPDPSGTDSTEPSDKIDPTGSTESTDPSVTDPTDKMEPTSPSEDPIVTEPTNEPTSPTTVAVDEDEADASIEDGATFALARAATTTCSIWTYDAFYLPAKYSVNLTYTLKDGVTRVTGDLNQVTWHYVNSPYNPGYCLEPNKQCGYGFNYKTQETTSLGAESTGTVGSVAWNNLTFSQQEAIGLVGLYSVPNNLWDDEQGFDNPETNTNRGYFAAGQILIWEFVIGLRSPYWPYGYSSRSDAKALFNAFDGQYTFTECYNNLVSLLANHQRIPSFCSRYQGAAPTISLQPDGKGYYTATVTDTNGVLSNFNFTDATGDVTFTRNGNTLTIKAKELPDNSTFSSTKIVPSPASATYYLAYGNPDESNYQTLMTCIPGTGDPVPAYFNLKLPTVDVPGTKTTSTGADLGGWEFQLKDGDTVIATATSDSKGKFTFENVSVGTYTLVEVIPDGSKYTCSNNNQTVVVAPDGSTTVSVHNEVITGEIKVIKATDTGNGVDLGWTFNLWLVGDPANRNNTANWTLKGTGTTKKDATDPSVTFSNLAPGLYVIQEVSSATHPGYSNDNSYHFVELGSGSTSTVTVTNTQLGSITLLKGTNTGSNLGGWKVNLYNEEKTLLNTYEIPDTGTLTITDLSPGTYYLAEQGSTDPYWECDTDEKTVVVYGGQNSNAEFKNIHRGYAKILKATNTGEDLYGWQYGVYSDESCSTLVTTITTDTTGSGGAYIEPGIYWVKEIGSTDGNWGSEYWVCDTTPQMVEIKAGEEVSLSFTNYHYGKISIIKAMDTDGPLGGWQFKITDAVTGTEVAGSPFTSSDDGTIVTGVLPPGSYIVEEIIPEDSLYYCKSENPQTVTVTAGSTASVRFTNALRPGRIEIEKVNFLGQHLEGAKFLLEWSEDGTTWNPVTYSDNEDVIKGGCTTEDLADGCLVTGTSGIISFEGLYPGLQYRLTEVEAPEGYVLLTDYAFNGELPIDDLEVTLTVYNSQGYILPTTGVEDTAFTAITISTVVAMLALMLGITLMLTKKPAVHPIIRKNTTKGRGAMKKTFVPRILSLLLICCLLGSLAVPALAAETTSVIDPSKKGSIEIYKYDMTNAEKDGVWTSSYVSTGVYDENVNNTLGGATRAGDTNSESVLGNTATSNGYAVAGVEFTYLKVASIYQYTESIEVDGQASSRVQVLYGLDAEDGLELLAAIGLTVADRYEDADPADLSVMYFQGDVLNNALRDALAVNATTVKNALETYVKKGGTSMALTDKDGYTSASNLDLGLYLIVETMVPEMVTNTCNPFFLSLPMTSVAGSNVSDGGTKWLYDVTLYPKNETGIPTLTKEIREAQADTGKNQGSNSITDGFAHTATGSTGDIMEYQILSTLPSITSTSTQISVYTFFDTLEKGLTYTKDEVILEFFLDSNCTQPVTRWTEADGMFTVTYAPSEAVGNKDSSMTIAMTDKGLAEINTSAAVYGGASEVRRGFSDLTLRITYAAKLDSDNTVTFGDAGNDNKVILTWKRSSSEYLDTLIDDCHVYTYGLDLTKVFVNSNDPDAIPIGDFSKVEFVLYNNTDKYWVKAELNDAEGVYYVTDHLDAEHGGTEAEASAEKAGATKFVPIETDGKGKIIVMGLEDDEYLLTEVQTDSGFTLLKDHIAVTILASNSTTSCGIYSEDVLGLVQNDPRYLTIVNAANVDTVLGLKNMPQKALAHKVLTASATVDGNTVTMLEVNGSSNALAPLTVTNDRGFNLPQTGEFALTWMPIIGGTVFGLALLTIFLLPKRKKEDAAN